jgi:ubiquinol-cytochrome c reductase iron-sulfur subunit
MSKNKQGKKHIHILDGMSLYTRDKSPFYWGYLNIDGEIHKKSLKTTDKKEAEKLLFQWKSHFSNNADNYVVESPTLNIQNENPKVDNTRRKALMITSGLMGAVTVAGFAVPFLSAWNPSEKAKALGASVKFDLSKLEPGAMAVVEWRRTPIFVVHQTSKALENLPKLNDRVTDPALSEGVARSSNERYTVLKGVCTHLSCAPKYHPEIEPKAWDEEWLGGFFCPCHGSKFDLAGRVYKGVPAPINLEVPPHSFDGDTLIIGEPT